jgi:hypothetical protein
MFRTDKNCEHFLNVMHINKKNKIAIGAHANAWAEGYIDHKQTLLYASFVGSSSAVQGLLAACRKGETIARSSYASAKAWKTTGPGGQGRSFTEKVSFDDHQMLHGIWICAHPNLLMAENDQACWKLLRARHNIAGLPEWGEEIMKELKEENLLEDLQCFGCHGQLFKGEENDLDRIVVDKVKSKKLAF